MPSLEPLGTTAVLGGSPATICLCKARKEAHAAQAFRHKAYMGAQEAQAFRRKAHMEAQAAVAVWRAPSRAVLLHGLAVVRVICLRSWPIG